MTEPTRYRVDWCASVKIVDGEADIDNADYRGKYFRNFDDAARFARVTFAAGVPMGCVEITEQVLVTEGPDSDLYGRRYWDPTRDLYLDEDRQYDITELRSLDR